MTPMEDTRIDQGSSELPGGLVSFGLRLNPELPVA